MKFNMQLAAKIMALGITTVISSNATAGLSNEQLLKVLLDNGTITQQQYDELSVLATEDTVKESKALEDSATAKADSAKANKKLSEQVIVSTKGGHLKFKSPDDQFKFQVGGRVMVDSAWYMADNNVANPENNWGNGTEIRRARLFIKGTVWNHWDFKFQYDFAGSGAIKDAFISYHGFGQYSDTPIIRNSQITVGNFKEPFSLEELTSSKYITFMERGLPNALAPGRNVGVAYQTHSKVLWGSWTAATGWFTDGVTANNDDGQNEGNAVAGRLTFAPWATKAKKGCDGYFTCGATVLHVGGAVEYRTYDEENIRIRQRPEAHTASHRMVDTGTFAADNSLKWGVELAGVYGPFSIQGEYMQNRIDLTDYSESAQLDGWYGYASWFITGESRRYKSKYGVFGRVKPKGIVGRGGWGAWEFAARYSNLDLNSGPLEGFKENNITIGLNWYATPTIRFMANYIIADSDNPEYNDPDIFQLRGQIDF